MERSFEAAAAVFYLLAGLLQGAAVFAGLEDWIGLPWWIAIVLCIPLAWIPFAGWVLGIAGALGSFRWPWWGAVLLAFPQVAVLPFGMIALTWAERRNLRLVRGS